jgi:hypothetical protein
MRQQEPVLNKERFRYESKNTYPEEEHLASATSFPTQDLLIS